MTAPLPGSVDILSALSSDIRKDIRFCVKLEGLFEDVELRRHMQRWGGNAFFDKDGKIQALQYNGETVERSESTGEKKDRWEQFKFIFRSSLVSTVTAFDHLVTVHIMSTN